MRRRAPFRILGNARAHPRDCEAIADAGLKSTSARRVSAALPSPRRWRAAVSLGEIETWDVRRRPLLRACADTDTFMAERHVGVLVSGVMLAGHMMCTSKDTLRRWLSEPC
jgi:hypothetical protein